MADRMRRGRVAAPVFAVALVVAASLLISGCSELNGALPEPTPLDFGGIVYQLALEGVTVSRTVSGDAGCGDATIIPTAVGFDVSGLGVAQPIRARVYIFRDGATFDRRRPDVDTCVAAWATDPSTFELIDARPFVLAGQGPWPDEFKAAVREALTAAAGTGG